MDKKYLTQVQTVIKDLKDMLSIMDHYPSSDQMVLGILDIINMISDYREEGMPLYPEVIVLNSIDYLKALPCLTIKVAKKTLESHDFSRCIKMCAPLAVNGWHIYIVVDEKKNEIEYGILTTERFALSLSLFEQTIVTGTPELNCLYLRNVGNKVVEVCNVQNCLVISLSLTEEENQLGESIQSLVDIVLSKDQDDLRETRNFLEKLIHRALNEGHGNLIAVVHDDNAVIEAAMKSLKGGIYLDTPIDFKELAEEYKSSFSEEASIKLNSYASLVRSMLNFDGITLFTDEGKVLGYHFIIDNDSVQDKNGIQGGSRTRAYYALHNSEFVKACFMRSQDGRVLFDSK